MNQITIENQDDAVVMCIAGAIKTADALSFGEELKALIEANDNIIIDMKDTEFICSGVLRELLACQTIIDESDDKEMTLINLNDEISDVIEMTGFANILNIE